MDSPTTQTPKHITKIILDRHGVPEWSEPSEHDPAACGRSVERDDHHPRLRTESDAASTMNVKDGFRVCNPRPGVETACRPFCLSDGPGMSMQAVGLKTLPMRGSLRRSGSVHRLSRVTLGFWTFESWLLLGSWRDQLENPR